MSQSAENVSRPGEASRQEWVAAQLDRAMRSIRQHGPAGALGAIDTVLNRYFDDSPTLAMGIKLAEQTGDSERMVRYRTMSLCLNPDDIANRLALAGTMIDLGQFETSFNLLDRLSSEVAKQDVIQLKMRAALASRSERHIGKLMDSLRPKGRSPADIKHVEAVASAFVDAGELKLGLDWLGLNAPLEDIAPALTMRRATMLYRLKKWKEADLLFSGLEDDADPRRRQSATIHRARIASNLADVALARTMYERVLEAAPSHEEACGYLIRHALSDDNVAEAEAYLARFEEAAPNSVALVWLKAALLTKGGHADEALALFREALAKAPENIDLRLRFADLLTEQGRLDEAAAAVKTAFEQAPTSAKVFSRVLRMAQLRDRPVEEIVAHCEEFLKVEPNNEGALLQRANGLLRLGRRPDALVQYAEGARLHPRNATFWRSAAALAVNLNRKAEAKSLAEEARRHFDLSTVRDLSQLADIYDAAGDSDETLTLAEAAVALDPSSPDANLITGRVWMGRGCYDKAWPFLRIAGASTTRSQQSVEMLARAAAGFRYLRPSQADLVEIEPIGGQFPDVLFEDMVGRSAIRPRAECRNKVLHVSSTLASGGAERQVAVTVAGLARIEQSLAVEFVADDLDPANGRDFFLPVVEKARVPVHVLHAMREAGAWRELLVDRPELRQAVRLLGALPADLARYALPMFVLFAQQKPAAVHLWQDMIAVSGGIAAILAGVPRIILSIRSTRPIEQQRYRPYFHAAYSAFLERSGVTMIGNSHNGARDYEDWLGIAAGRVGVVYNGYDFQEMRSRTDPARAAAIRVQNISPPDALVFGGVMRCSFEKRPELWTAVACELVRRDARVFGILVGDGPMRGDLEAEVERLGLSHRIRFVGRQSPIEPWMAAMNVLFLSSLTEGLPNVLIEAQSLGVPVATMRVGGAPETVEEGRTAVVIDEGTPAEVADAVGTLLFDGPKRRAFGTAAAKWAQGTFSVDAMLAKLGELYDQEC
jgi:glycosyltransferase involved in cell wall biosynthesis/tetratricopeptide (TPR) repeat protein